MEEVRKTIAEVERAKKDFPELKIAVTTKVMKRSWIEEKEGAIYGTLIKELYDTALRAIQKAGLEDDVYLLTNDADTRGLSADYVGSFLRFVESHPNLDGAIGKIDWGSEAWADYPGFHVAMRNIQLIDTAYRNRTGAQKGISSHGPNFIMKASMYAAIGGNETEIGAGADTDIGKRMVAARIGDRKEFRQGEYPLGYNNGAWVDSDPSRALEFYKRNAPVVDRWNDWDEGGYKPRQDLESLTGDSEDLDSDFENILKRIEFQVSEATSKWISFYNRELAEATLNIAFPPKEGKPMWEIVDDSHIVFTEVGREVMREQLSLYRKENRQNIKYEKGRGGVRAGEEGTPGPAGSPWARATRRAEAAGNGGGGNAETTPFATIQPEQAAELTSEGRRKITEEALKAADLLKPNREVRIGTRVAKVRSVDYEREFLEITSFSNDRETRFIPISEILRRPSYKRKAAVKHYLELVDNR
jgi:hypothetical protein